MRAPDHRQGSHQEIRMCREDLESLQRRASGLTGARLSKNDLLVGLVWVLRCLLEASPLPGQVSPSCTPCCWRAGR